MSDLIDRQEAIDAIKILTDSICEGQAIDALNELPSVQPEMPKWAKKVEAEYKKAMNMPHIKTPMAWALYQVWKEYDSK